MIVPYGLNCDCDPLNVLANGYRLINLQGVSLATSQTAENGCSGGKSFYCTSATEFVHCIESPPGVFTSENIPINCPEGTFCDNNVAWECSGMVPAYQPQVMPGECLI